MAAKHLDAVLPLTARDAERAQILFRSLETLFEPPMGDVLREPDPLVAALCETADRAIVVTGMVEDLPPSILRATQLRRAAIEQTSDIAQKVAT